MHGNTILSLILNAGLVVKFVLLILLFFSVFSWAIIFYKFRLLSRVEKESSEFKRSFEKIKDWDSLYQIAKKQSVSPLVALFKAAYSVRDSHELPEATERDEMKRALKRVVSVESTRLERYLTFLATTGSTTPFIGLFGTVWGIMNSFSGIGRLGSASLAVVAPGIAEALIATAAGLAAAIPAVIAYNYYLSRTRRNIIAMEDFAQELIESSVRSYGETKAGAVRD
jgi:biopolymer transport protein TolQ